MVMLQGSDVNADGLDGLAEASGDRRSRSRLAIAAGAAVVLVLGGLVTGAVAAHRTNERYEAAVAAYSAGLDKLISAYTDARDVLESSEGRVLEQDEPLRTELADFVAGAEQTQFYDASVTEAHEVELPAAFSSVTTLSSTDLSKGALADMLERGAADAAAWIPRAIEATEAVVAAQGVWEVAQAQAGYDDALATMVAALDTGEATLSGSEGEVADNAVRQSLRDALDEALALLDAVPAAEVDALVTATTALQDAKTTVDAAADSVADARATWQAEQEQIAAEQAAAAAAAAEAARAAARTSSASSSSGSTHSSPATPSTSSSASATGTAGSSVPSTGGGQWVVTEEIPMPDRCFDEFGNSWDC